MAENLKRGTRVTGADRSELAADLSRRYGAGESIRSLATSTGRSYGFIHRILTETGVALRGRGGATKKATPKTAAAGKYAGRETRAVPLAGRTTLRRMVHGPGMMMARGFRMDPSVTKQKLKPGTIRRIAGYARPYRVQLTIFLIATALDACITVVNPLLLRELIDDGIVTKNEAVVVVVGATVAGVAVFDAFLGVVNRWYSSRIGEGLIYDLRTQVFDHVQRQPLAFFTRAQTGSLVSRLDGDVVGAQQAIVGTLSRVLSNVLSVIVILITLFYLSWLVSLIALVLIPLFIYPARRLGRRLQRLSRESMQLNAEMGSTMTERFNVAGAMLAKLYGRPREESQLFAAKAHKVREIGVTRDMYGSVFMIAITLLDRAVHRRRLRRRRHPGDQGRVPVRHPGRARAAARPGLRSDRVAVQRADPGDDRPGQLRPGLRGARPGAADHREAGRGGAARPRRRRDRARRSGSTGCRSATRPRPRSPSRPWSRSR